MRCCLGCLLLISSSFFVQAADVRLTNDNSPAGYVSTYSLATGTPYTDAVLQECSVSKGRQNEPSVAIDPRNTQVILGSSNDYCGVYAGSPPSGPVPAGPVWLGYYRSENGGASFQSSLVPGYPGDTSPYAKLAKVRTAGSGDPVIAWDNHGRAFFGSESSGDPAGSKKGFGDVWVARFDNPGGENGATINDGKRFLGSVVVGKGSSSPTSGKFNDKTAIEVDRTGGACDGYVYFAWSRFTGSNSNIYISRSTDHAATWSSPALLTSSTSNVQDPDISVTGKGNVYVTFDQGPTRSGQQDAVAIVKSTDCGRTFSAPSIVTGFIPYEARDLRSPQPVPDPVSAHDDPGFEDDENAPSASARDCGDFDNACQSPFTFFRRATSPRSTADQSDRNNEWIYVLYDASKAGTQTPTGNTYGSISPGTGSQSGIFFVRVNGSNLSATSPVLIDNQAAGHQFFPDVSADQGILHAIWWDSRNDPSYSARRPVGNDENGQTYPSLDVFRAKSLDNGNHWTVTQAPINAARSNPNFEQFDDRTVPFAGDYLWVSSVGSFAFATWTDWRDTLAGPDPREPASTDAADVTQCRTFDSKSGTWSSDQCPHSGGLDQNIYGTPIHDQ